jgi:hypothetical protein
MPQLANASTSIAYCKEDETFPLGCQLDLAHPESRIASPGFFEHFTVTFLIPQRNLAT